MMPWYKILIGAVLIVNFSIPLAVVSRTKALHDEPMALFVGNLALADLLFGVDLLVIGIADLLFREQLTLSMCISLQFWTTSTGIALKTAHLMIAVDQVIAIVYPLHYYMILEGWTRRMLAAPWVFLAVFVLVGVVASALQLNTEWLEFGWRIENLAEVDFECRWEILSSTFVLVVEAVLLLTTIVTGALFVFGAVQGIRMKEKMNKQVAANGDSKDHNKFSARFKSFKRIGKVLGLFIVLDIFGAVGRIYGRVHDMPVLSCILHIIRCFGVVVEAWTYGLNNTKIRMAYRRIFACRSKVGNWIISSSVKRSSNNSDNNPDTRKGY